MKVKDIFKTKKQRLLIFSPNLYLSDSIKEEKLDTIKYKLLHKPLLASVTLLILSENSSDQIDILHSRELLQPVYEVQRLRIVGIARDHEEAVSLVIRITQDCLSARGDCSLKEYLLWQ